MFEMFEIACLKQEILIKGFIFLGLKNRSEMDSMESWHKMMYGMTRIARCPIKDIPKRHQ